MAERIDPADYAERLERISGIFSGMIATATTQATFRCPYRNRSDECTAGFGCRNQRWPNGRDVAALCGADDKLDYRGAWDSS